jgi:hypothetical protein
MCYSVRMDTCACIRYMMEKAGMSGRQLSVSLGKAPTYVGTTLSRNGSVSVENLAKMAEIMGFKVVVEGHGERVSVTERGVEDSDGNQGTAHQQRGGSTP